jgi:hypothetical protein
MKTKNIFNRLALAMLMPTMLLTTACSNEDDNLINNDNNNQKGFELPVTVNVTREGDKGTTRASFNGTTLSFSTGDKLFVRGGKSNKKFAGTLDWVSGGTFSGTITIQSGYTGNTGTADALLSDAQMPMATLLPAGYETPGYLSISGSGATASISSDASKAFATTKAAAVEQFSYENAMYSSGFALSPRNAILNFTITGLTASTEYTATLSGTSEDPVSGSVTTDGSGNATFAMAIKGGSYNINQLTLTVGGKNITFTSSDKSLAKGKIYNITRAIP